MTAQEVLHFVVAFMRKQGRPSVIADGSCRYRGPGGTKCAVGCLIPDDAYSETIEGWGLGANAAVDRAIAGLGMGSHMGLLISLQAAHDLSSVSDGWLGRFESSARDVAAEFGLSYPEASK